MKRIALLLCYIGGLFGQGTSLPTSTWTNLSPGGYTVTTVGYDGTEWISSRKCMAIWGEALPGSFSENNDSLFCYSYAENRWHQLSISGGFHSTHRPPQGHSNQTITYVSDLDSLFYFVDGSFGNTSENYGGVWQLDMAGLTGRDRPLMTSSSTLTRQWLPGASTPINASVYDSTHQKFVFFTDYNLSNGQATICNLTAFTCSLSSTTNGPPTSAVGQSISGTFDSSNAKIYFFMASSTPFYSFDANANAWAALSPTITGPDSAALLSRQGAGLAYSSTDNVILLMGGYNGSSTNYLDTWKWDPVANTVTELCGPGMSACGYPNTTSTKGPGNKLVYDPTDNAFIYLSGSNQTWGYALSTALNFNRAPVNYAPPAGSLNKTAPPASPSLSTVAGYAADPAISLGGGNIYIAHVETAPSTDGNSNCWPLITYIYNLTGSAYLPTGSLDTGCSAIGNGSNIWPSSHSYTANVNGTVWEAHSMTNQSGGSADTRSFAASYGGSTWTRAQVGCFTASCATVASTPTGLIAVGTTPTVAVIEQTKSLFVRENYLYVAQWGGSSWSALGAALNINAANSGTYVSSASVATDGTNPAACWTERIDTARNTMGTTPQVQCSKWSGSAWVRMGTTSLNQTGSDFAYSPSLTYYSGNWYVAFTEGTQTGNINLYVKVFSSGGNSWSLVGSGSLNNNTSTGLAYHASLTSDVTNLYVAWEEQSALGSHSLGYIKYGTGTTWTTLATSIAADPTNGSIEDIGIVASAGVVTAAWDEWTWGNLRQIYSQTFSANPTLSVPLTVQEALIPGTNGFSGLTRTNDPLTVGVPIPDSVGLTVTTSLGLTGASAAQFSTEATWPSGNIKWLKIRAIIPSVTGGSTATVTLVNTGSGNFGGANMATDNGTTITVNTTGGTCGAGSAICFTIKKSNFNFIDALTIGSTTVVTSGASTGLVVTGPPNGGTYPANVTCSPTSGGAACTTAFTSANDGTNSTCTIEENGPAIAVLKCSSDLNDGSAHVYMHQTTRMYFYQNRAQVKYTTALRNADYGTNNTFATASKGFNAFELRVTPTISGTLTYKIANDAGITTSTMSGSDTTYLYQAESNLAKSSSWCNATCNPPSTISGWAIMHNGSAVLTGSASQYPTGWADIATSGGVGILIGQDQFAAYGNKSLEFLAGGSDVRLGLWARENNTTSPSTTTPNAPYYQPWPQWSIQNGWLEFHTTAPANLANDHLMLQYPLLARAAVSWYNTAAVFPFPLLDPTEETNYYVNTLAAAVPSVSTLTPIDWGMGDTSISNQLCQAWGGGAIPTVCIYRYWLWSLGGGGNQMEYHLANIYDFLRRGYSGEYMNAHYWYKWAAEDAFPLSDGFKWTAHATQTAYYGYPCIDSGTTGSGCTATGSANYPLTIAGTGGATRLNIEDDMEHGNAQGYDTFYLVSGDETIKDAYMEAVVPFFANNASASNYTASAITSGGGGALNNDRSVGNVFKWGAHLYTFLNSVGNSTDANTILTNMQAVYQARLQPSLCAYSNYPAGCTPSGDATNFPLQIGTSLTRGVSNVYNNAGITISGCPNPPNGNSRAMKSFMASRKIEGMLEFYQVLQGLGSPWTYTTQFWDYIYGATQWAFGEMMVDNGATAWTGNGFRYGGVIDYANACNSDDWSNLQNETVWHHWIATELYAGPLSAARVREFNYVISNNRFNGNIDEFYHDTMATAIYYILHPQTTSLQTLAITSFTNNGGGSYTIGWATPPGTTQLRVKSGLNQIVDWIGFNAGTYAWIGNPATTQNWFASTEATGIPAPATGAQSMTITGLSSSSLSAANFMVKAMTTGSTTGGGSVILGSGKILGADVVH